MTSSNHNTPILPKNLQINQQPFHQSFKDLAYKYFDQQSLNSINIPWSSEEPLTFYIEHNNQIIAFCVLQYFFGQIHIRYLVVDTLYRRQRLGSLLLNHAFLYAKSRNATFVFLETMSFQNIQFYLSLGFSIQLSRPGFTHNSSFLYLIKYL